MSTSATLLLAEGASSPLSGLLPFILMIAVFYFLVLRPMSKQEKERKQRMSELKRGDRIVLTGGLLGRISRIEPDDDVAIIEIADKVKIRVLKKDIGDLESNALAKAKDDKKDGGKKDDKKDADKPDDKAADDDDDGDDDKSDKSDKGTDARKAG
ncbi:preprotein translocase subunit YajC [Nannocystaceae bacterium ST9]